ncbi:MAG: stage III sporulation protein AB [Corallococcus sp.]|nr:stage III sporulation protein AB [Corallococcus sp.]
MTDIVILILTGITGFLVGKHLENKLTKRERVFGELCAFCDSMANNIKSEKIALNDFIDMYQKKSSDEFSKVIKGASPILAKHENEKVAEFLDGIKTSNTDFCLRHIERYSEIFKSFLEKQLAEANSKRNVYIKVGVLMGIAVGLLFV